MGADDREVFDTDAKEEATGGVHGIGGYGEDEFLVVPFWLEGLFDEVPGRQGRLVTKC